jgi:hypothetical protein
VRSLVRMITAASEEITVMEEQVSECFGRARDASPGARAYYDELRARGQGHHAALRQLSNRLAGILHGCLKTGTLYDENTAWNHRQHQVA